MNSCSIRLVQTLHTGDHICIWDSTRWPIRYTHHGIVYKSGTTENDILIAHLWSPLRGFRRSQADSYFRITTLNQFMNQRTINDLRLVQYQTSILGNTFSKLGEVHRAISDLPPVVLERCNFLMGLGKGKFSILSSNCEHIAYWCKTGENWSKQIFSFGPTKIPFSNEISKLQYEEFTMKLHQIREKCIEKLNKLVELNGTIIYLQIDQHKYIQESQSLFYGLLNPFDEESLNTRDENIMAPSSQYSEQVAYHDAYLLLPTPFRIHIKRRYNYGLIIQLEILKAKHILKTNQLQIYKEDKVPFICSKAKNVIGKTRKSYHRSNSFTFQYTWFHELQSQRHRRWYLGIQSKNGLLRTYCRRDNATKFQFIPIEQFHQQYKTGFNISYCHQLKRRISISSSNENDEDHDDSSDSSSPSSQQSYNEKCLKEQIQIALDGAMDNDDDYDDAISIDDEFTSIQKKSLI